MIIIVSGMHLTKPRNTRTYLFYLIGYDNCYPNSYEWLNAGDERQEGKISEAGSIESLLTFFFSEFLIGIKMWCQLQIISGNRERLSAVFSQETGIYELSHRAVRYSVTTQEWSSQLPIKTNTALQNLWYWLSETLGMETVDPFVFDFWYTLAYTCIYTS